MLKRTLTLSILVGAMSASVALAGGPLDGVSRSANSGKNGAFEATTFGTQNVPGVTSKEFGEPGDVSITSGAIGVDVGRGGEFASSDSVVSTTADNAEQGITSGVRVALPD